MAGIYQTTPATIGIKTNVSPAPKIISPIITPAPMNTNPAPTPAPVVTKPSTNSPSSVPAANSTSSATVYDYNTGKPLAPGQAQSLYNTQTGQKIGYDPTLVSNPTGPSSSSTVSTNNNITTNTTSGTATANGTQTPLSDLQNRIMSSYGFDENYVRGLSSDAQAQFALSLKADDVAQKQADDAKAEEQQQYQTALAAENASYASATADLNSQKAKDLDTAKATAAQLNPYGGPNTDEDNYTGAINTQYDKLQQSLDSQAEQAKAALAAGDMKAYTDINNNLAQTKATGLANIANMLNDLTKTATQNDQFEQTEADKKATLDQNNQLKTTSLLQTALTNPSITAQSGAKVAALPSDWNSMTPQQQAQADQLSGGLMTMAQQTGNYLDANGNFSPAKAWTNIQGGLTNSFKAQAQNEKAQNDASKLAVAQANSAISANRAQAYMLTAQANLADKQAGAIDSQTVASVANGAFLDAFQNAQASGKYTKDKNTTTLSTLASNLSSGDTTNAKTALVNYALSGGSATDQRMYNTLQGLPALVSSVKAKIAALPADQQQSFLTGSINDVAAKFGQNPNPQLQEIALELGHLQKNYVAPIYGMRAAAGSTDSIFNNLFPSGTDSKSLSLTKLDALTNTAQDTVNAQVQARIGSDPYNQIFGTGGALNPSAPVSAGTWQGLPIGQTMLNQKDGKTYTITAAGPVLK